MKPTLNCTEDGPPYGGMFNYPPTNVVLTTSDDPEGILAEVATSVGYLTDRPLYVFEEGTGIYESYQFREKDLPASFRTAKRLHERIHASGEFSEVFCLSSSPWMSLYRR